MLEVAVHPKKRKVYFGKIARSFKQVPNRYFICDNTKMLKQRVVSRFPSLKDCNFDRIPEGVYTSDEIKEKFQKSITLSSPVEKPKLTTITANPSQICYYSWSHSLVFVARRIGNIEQSIFSINSSYSSLEDEYCYVIEFNKYNFPRYNVARKVKYSDLEKFEKFIAFPKYQQAMTFVSTMYPNNHFIVLENGQWNKVEGNQVRKMILTTPSFFQHHKAKFFNNEKEMDDFLNKNKTNETHIDIFVDGSSNNQDKYSWAYVVYNGEEEIAFDKGHEENTQLIKHGSQIGEFLAMIHAMDYIIENKIKNVIVWYDNVSNYNCMETLSTTASKVLTKVFEKYYHLMLGKRQIIEGMNLNVEFLHAKAHSGVKGNERADYYAKRAIKEVNYFF